MFDWLVENAAHLTNAGNGMWICISAMVAYYMLRLNRQTHDDMVRTLTSGIALVAVSSGLHRLWWFMGIQLAPPGSHYAQWALDYRGLLTVLVLTLCLGYALHIKTALHSRCGKMWWLRPTLAVLIGAALGWAQ